MDINEYGPVTAISKEVHATKYRGENETFYDYACRVSAALADSEEHRASLKETLLDQRFLPGGRIQAGAGSPKKVTLFNCFLSPKIEDNSESIMNAVKDSFMTLRTGGGIGYDFSGIRYKGARINSLDSSASGPLSFMDIFDATCKAVMSAGHRRGAQMAALRCDHPDIEAFVRSKQNETRFRNFNISVGVTDKFMQAVVNKEPFDLVFDGKVISQVDAYALWEEIMRSTYDYAEPGILFLDTINNNNNLWYAEELVSSNPCGEVPLGYNGTCLLGSLNLVKYITRNAYKSYDGTTGYHFNVHKFSKDIFTAVRALDRVIDISMFPLEAQKIEAQNKRRMGLGITGLANCLEIMGMKYGDEESLIATKAIMTVLRNTAYAASIELAKEKGSFPLFDVEKFLASEFVQGLPLHLQEDIRKYGIRNSHLISIAPTGTISLTADNVSSGIEPPFQLEYTRYMQLGPDEGKTEVVKDFAWNFYGVKGRTANEISAKEHVDMLTTVAKYVDQAVSKTCNVGPEVSWDEFKDIYMQAWKGKAKGVTTFREVGKRFGVLRSLPPDAAPVESDVEEGGGACTIDLVTGIRSCSD